MACTANKTPLLRSVASRGFSAQANLKAAGRAGELQCTTLPNKLTVASIENSSPISRVSISFRAGSRNEQYDNQGASHLLRIAGGLTNRKSTTFAVTRNIQQIGGSISVTSDRELVTYNLVCRRTDLDTGLRFLQDVATEQVFKPWELSDSLIRAKVDVSTLTDQVRAVELLHKAAYRTGLGNSLFCPSFNLGNLSSEALQHYVASTFTTNRASVVGVGIDQNLLTGYAKNLNLQSGDGVSSGKATYYGLGDLREDKSGGLATVAVAGEGAGWANTKEALAFAVLQCASGCGPSTKYGNTNGVLGKLVTSAMGNSSFAVNAFNAIYSDSGLFGFVISGDAQSIGKGVEAAAKGLKSGSVSADDVARGKALLKTCLLDEVDSGCGLVSNMAAQAALAGSVLDVNQMVAGIDSVTASDVSGAARKVASSKLSLAAVGNLANVPHVTQL